MRRIITVVMILVLAATAQACSIVDPDDRKQLEDQIAALPDDVASILREWAAQKAVIKWLRNQIGKKGADIECQRIKAFLGDGKVLATDWKPVNSISTDEILSCMETLGATYSLCAETIALQWQASYQQAIASTGSTDGIQCRQKYVPGFEPDQVAAEARDATTANPGDMNRLAELLTIGQVADALIGAPKLPPELASFFAAGGALEPFLPALCGLSAGGWGCPSSPDYPGDKGASQ